MSNGIYEEIPLNNEHIDAMYEKATPPKPKITLKVRNVVITRDNVIKLEHNKQVKEKLISLLEEMAPLKAFYSFDRELRSDIKTVSTGMNDIGTVHTIWGDLTMEDVLKRSERKELVNEALLRMGMDIDTLKFTKYNSYIIMVDTSGLEVYPTYMEAYRKISREFIAGSWDGACRSNVLGAEKIPSNITYMAKALKWIKEHEEERKRYITLYSRFKELFRVASYNGPNEKPDGKFPRTFNYNLVGIHWDDVSRSGNFNKKLKAYFTGDMDMFRVFKSHMKDVWNERQEMRSTVLLDGYDHEQRLDDEDW